MANATQIDLANAIKAVCERSQQIHSAEYIDSARNAIAKGRATPNQQRAAFEFYDGILMAAKEALNNGT